MHVAHKPHNAWPVIAARAYPVASKAVTGVDFDNGFYFSPNTVVVRGGGDIATGVIQKLWRAGLHILVLETARPLTIRRTVALSSCMYEGVYRVEDMTAVRISSPEECGGLWERGLIPALADPHARSLDFIKPAAVVDAIIAKRNMGTHRGMAPLTIALGPGFSAPEDVDCVIETMRGHSLGRVITKGAALPNTGIPGEMGGKSAERVVHSPASGLVRHIRALGDAVTEGEALFTVGGVVVRSPLSGTLRGLIAEGLEIRKELKCADIDPRPAETVDYLTISDKARAVGGAVLEAWCMMAGEKKMLPATTQYARAPFKQGTGAVTRMAAQLAGQTTGQTTGQTAGRAV